jgi:hypothetical protein
VRTAKLNYRTQRMTLGNEHWMRFEAGTWDEGNNVISWKESVTREASVGELAACSANGRETEGDAWKIEDE